LVRVWVGVLRVRLRLPGARTLKDRRRVVLSLRDRAVARFAVCAAETGDLENPQVASLAFSAVSADPGQVRERLAAVRGQCELVADAMLLEAEVTVLPVGE
jgi:uncharacterized protein YlxP (DUF503 family)